jgi:hypothetical protein
MSVRRKAADTPTDEPVPLVGDGAASARLREQGDAAALSRRGVLWRAGLATAAGVTALTALDEHRAEAATGGNFVLGNSNNANATTSLAPTGGTVPNPLMFLDGSALASTQTTLVVTGPVGGTGTVVNGSSTGSTVGLALRGNGSGSATGLFGSSGSGTGVLGSSSSGAGVVGNSGSSDGVQGSSSTGTGVVGASSGGDGVHGTATANAKTGVLGSDTSATGGTGVSGVSTHGVAVRATSALGTALSVTGKTHFSRSGSGSVAAGHQTAVVSIAGLSSSNLVLVTLQKAAAGVYVEAATPATGKFTLILNKATPISLKFAWFVIN